jgi:DNA-binding LacI/PurR family transcriptional regulator
MNQMLQKGLLLGRDVELLGFKDGDQVQYGLQCMSLVCQPTNQLGKLAGQMLFERLENPHLPQRHTILKAVFTPRMAEGHYLVM